jgi:hypothetical protein
MREVRIIIRGEERVTDHGTTAGNPKDNIKP